MYHRQRCPFVAPTASALCAVFRTQASCKKLSQLAINCRSVPTENGARKSALNVRVVDVSFPKPVTTRDEAKQAIVELSNEASRELGVSLGDASVPPSAGSPSTSSREKEGFGALGSSKSIINRADHGKVVVSFCDELATQRNCANPLSGFRCRI